MAGRALPIGLERIRVRVDIPVRMLSTAHKLAPVRVADGVSRDESTDERHGKILANHQGFLDKRAGL